MKQLIAETYVVMMQENCQTIARVLTFLQRKIFIPPLIYSTSLNI